MITPHLFDTIPFSIWLHTVDGNLISTGPTANPTLYKAVKSAFCHWQSRRSHWAGQQPAAHHKSHRLWTTTHISFSAKVSLSSNLQTWTHDSSHSLARWKSDQTNSHRGKVHSNFSLQDRWLMSCSTAAHLTTCKCPCKCHFLPVRCWCGPYSRHDGSTCEI